MASVRVSCQTIALWTGWPVVRSQTSAVSRWLVIPTAAMSLSSRSALASAPEATRRVFSHTSFALCSTQPAFGKICSCSRWSTETTRPSRLKTMHRTEVVPESMAATNFSLMRCYFPFIASTMKRLTTWLTHGRGARPGCGPGASPITWCESASGHAGEDAAAAQRLEGKRAQRAADERTDDRHPGIAPVRRTLTADRQDGMRDAG